MGDPLIVSEKYLWHEKSKEFANIKDGTRHSDSLYEAKVDVYEDRVRSWFLDLAVAHLANGQNPADYVALSIALAYIEGVEQYRRGSETPRGSAKKWFKSSAQRIIPSATEDALDRLWKEARCGIFHSGFTNGPTYLSHDNPNTIEISQDRLNINPKMFVNAVNDDFSSYILELRAKPEDTLGKNFVKQWDTCWEAS
jgi:hypothetical protein